jgi:hypothetical protein
MMVTTQDKIALRKRLYNDFEFYAKHALKVRSKQNKIVPFELNPVQQKFHAEVEDQRRRTGRVRKIILKGRQQGLSTYVSGRKYFRLSQRSAKKGIVIAHKADSTKALWQMYKRYHASCPLWLKPSTQYASGKELTFDKLDTGLVVATAGGDGVGRGEMLSDMHLSELAFWPASSAEETLNGLLQCMPFEDDTEAYIESTANGFNLFKEQWDAAVSGESEFEPFFSPWFDSPEYRMPVPDGFERTLEEDDLAALYGLDDQQLMFRRKKIGTHGRMKFMQEYPCTPDEAFIASGRPVFDPEQVVALIAEAPAVLKGMDVEEVGMSSRGHPILRLGESPVGRLLVYREHEIGEQYTIGADVGLGVQDGDYSVAHVLDSDKRQVAVFRAQVHPDYFADILACIGRHYNDALIGPERNNHGLVTCLRLYKDLAYPNVYLDLKEGQIEDQDTLNIGHYTDVKTRPLIIDRLRGAMRDLDISVHDVTTLKEMQTFVVNEAGKMTAEAKCHDDCVMSLAIANHIHPGRVTPVIVPDDYYVNAI